MRGKRAGLFTALMILAFMVTGCGPSDEKLAEAESARSTLQAAKKAAEETYLDITESTNRQRLDELAESASQYESMDFTKMRDKKIDEVLPGIQELTTEYLSLGDAMDDVLKAETAARDDAAKRRKISAFFVNKTGLDLTEILFRDVTQNEVSKNFIKEGTTLAAGYTLMGATLEVYEGSSEWEVVVKDTNNTEHVLVCDSLENANPEGIALTLTYDSKSETGQALLESYTATAEPSDAADQASSEASGDEAGAVSSDSASAETSEAAGN